MLTIEKLITLANDHDQGKNKIWRVQQRDGTLLAARLPEYESELPEGDVGINVRGPLDGEIKPTLTTVALLESLSGKTGSVFIQEVPVGFGPNGGLPEAWMPADNKLESSFNNPSLPDNEILIGFGFE